MTGRKGLYTMRMSTVGWIAALAMSSAFAVTGCGQLLGNAFDVSLSPDGGGTTASPGAVGCADASSCDASLGGESTDGAPSDSSLRGDALRDEGDGSSSVHDGEANEDAVGYCVVTRSIIDGGTCNPTCDQLQENGQHEYIEPNPDNGSPLPPGPLSSLDALFADASTSAGPCIVDPANGALFPNNWLRPRIFFQPSGPGPNYYQIRLHAADQSNDLVVYTESPTWEVPKDIWRGLAATTWGEDITVTVSEVNADGGSATSSQVAFQIAPATATGSIIYSAMAGNENGFSWLEGFGVADEGVTTVLTVPTGPFSLPATNTQWIWSRNAGGDLGTTNETLNLPLTSADGGPLAGDAQCIGCHAIVPDESSLSFIDFYPWEGVASWINPGGGAAVGQPPPWLTPGGAETLSQGGLGMMSFSTSVWNTGSHLVVAGTELPLDGNAAVLPWELTTDTNPSNLIWIDLSTAAAPIFVDSTGAPLASAASVSPAPFYANQGTTYGFIARLGDPNGASTPAWSNAGTQIVYSSNDASMSGRLATGSSDLWIVPFDPTTKQASGPAAPLPGASSTTANEYYPAVSPDDRYVSFNTVPAGSSMYYNADSEINVISFDGGAPTRLAANDPSQCMTAENGLSAVSPGLTNSWARWSPAHPTCAGRTYYWVIFSSTRLGIPFTSTTSPQNFQTPTAADEQTSQLYLTAIVDDGSGTLQTYPAISIWNQPVTIAASGITWNQGNIMPEWQVASIATPAPAPPPPAP